MLIVGLVVKRNMMEDNLGLNGLRNGEKNNIEGWRLERKRGSAQETYGTNLQVGLICCCHVLHTGVSEKKKTHNRFGSFRISEPHKTPEGFGHTDLKWFKATPININAQM